MVATWLAMFSVALPVRLADCRYRLSHDRQPFRLKRAFDTVDDGIHGGKNQFLDRETHLRKCARAFLQFLMVRR